MLSASDERRTMGGGSRGASADARRTATSVGQGRSGDGDHVLSHAIVRA